MERDDYILLMYKKLKGEASFEELDIIDRFIIESTENAILFEEIRMSWNQNHEQISIELDTPKELASLLNRIDESYHKKAKTKKIFPFKTLTLAASIIFIVGFFLFQSKNDSSGLNHIASNDVKHISLSDGSYVWLNEESTLKSDKGFGDSHRTILLSGEAYFDVAHNKNLPFKILINGVEVEVLGTAFNIKAVKNQVTVSVERGKVSVKDIEVNSKEILTKGMRTIVDTKAQMMSTDNSFDKNDLFWKSNRFVFQDINLQSAVDIINEKYQTDISILNPLLISCSISGTFQSSNIEDILNVIAKQFECTIEKINDRYVIRDGQCK